jgi:hypothetical protein
VTIQLMSAAHCISVLPSSHADSLSANETELL